MTDRRAHYQPKPQVFPSELRRLFRELARWAVASSFGVAAASCSSSFQPGSDDPDDPDVDDPQWQTPACDELGVFRVGELDAPGPIDYLAARQFESAQFAGMMPPWLHLYAEHGTACESATDQAACLDAVAALQTPPPACPCPAELIVTRGDEVLRIRERADYGALLGTINTSDEALLVAFLAGQQIECGSLGSTQTRPTAGGFEVAADWEACSSGLFTQTSEVLANGEVLLGERERTGDSSCVIGRRPEGLVCRTAPASSALGRYFADAAQLEGASVFAFDRLARELLALGAPDTLVAWAWRSAVEEIRHTQVVGALAQRFGARALPPTVAAEAPRTRFQIALENAVEGCVRETFGALLACHQALAARDEAVREAMRVIADDETRHAELAWAIAAWLSPQLSEAERALLAAARADAFALLAREPLSLPEAERAAIGWPSPEVSRALLAQLQRAIHSV